MYSYKFDDTGISTGFMSLVFLIPLLFLCIYMLLKKEVRYLCNCKHCMKKGGWRCWKWIATIVMMAIVAIQVRRVLRAEEKRGENNPYEILGLEEGCSVKEVKKVFRKLSTKYNVDVCPEEKREEYEEKLMKVATAYNMLKTGVYVPQNLGVEEEILALPGFVTGKGSLIAYALIFGVALPFWAYKKWKFTVEKNKIGVLHETVEIFYKKIKAGPLNLKALTLMVGNSKDIQIYTVKEAQKNALKQKIEENYAVPMMEMKKMSDGYLILMDHLFRTEQIDYSIRQNVLEKIPSLLTMVRVLSQTLNSKQTLENALILEKMINQAIFDPKYPELQYPGVTFPEIFLAHHKRQSLTPTKLSLKIQNSIPTLEATLPEASEGTITLEHNSLVTITVNLHNTKKGHGKQITLDSEGIGFALKPNGEEDISLLNGTGEYTREPVHTPYKKHTVLLEWTAFLEINGTLCQEVIRFSEFLNTKRILFPTFLRKGNYTAELTVMNNGYIGGDIKKTITIKAQ